MCLFHWLRGCARAMPARAAQRRRPRALAPGRFIAGRAGREARARRSRSCLRFSCGASAAVAWWARGWREVFRHWREAAVGAGALQKGERAYDSKQHAGHQVATSCNPDARRLAWGFRWRGFPARICESFSTKNTWRGALNTRRQHT